MSKKFMAFVTFILGVFYSILMCSCSSEHEDVLASNSNLIKILKSDKWISHDASYGEGDNDHAWVDLEQTTLYFLSDSTGSCYWVQRDYDTDLGNSKNPDYFTFNYSVSGNNVRISSQYNIVTYTYVNGYLTTGSNVFESAPMTSGDYDLIEKYSLKTGKCGPDLSYVYDPQKYELSITGKGVMDDYTKTNQPWHNFDVRSVYFGTGCIRIGNNAFYGQKHLTDVILQYTLQEIGDNAFDGTLLTTVDLPLCIEKIGKEAFANCSYLKKVTLSGCSYLKTIGDYAFYGCPVTCDYLLIPDNVETIGDGVFSSWKIANGRLVLNDKLTYIGNAVFSGIKGTLTIPNSVKSIGNLAFEGSFYKIVIGTGLSSLSQYAFATTSSSGEMFVNLGVPLTLESSMFAEDNMQASWKLYVPKGAKTVYSKDKIWKKFKAIYEDNSLISGNGEAPGDSDGTQEDDEVSTKEEYTGTIAGYHYVDLGLSVKWATKNIGAKNFTDYGDFFAWGEVYTKSDFDWNTYKWSKGTKSMLTKYNESQSYGIVDNKKQLETSDDVAYVKWGSKWRMPTLAEMQELKDKCKIKWCSINNCSGLKITGPNGNYIFLPAAGNYSGMSLNSQSTYGSYWTSSLDKNCSAYFLGFYANDFRIRGDTRYYGHTVRPVCE